MAEFVYSGGDTLEIMASARNYNAYLLRSLTRRLEGARTVLDFGAGTGHFAVEIAGLGYEVICVEPDARNRLRLASAGLRIASDLDTIAAGTIDLVYSLNVLEHIADDAGTLRSLRTKLKPHGGLFLYVPAFAMLFSRMDKRVGHLRRYRRRPFIALVERSGYRVEAARYVDCLGFLVALGYKHLDRGKGELSERSVVAYDRTVFPVSRLLSPPLGRLFGKNIMLFARRA